MVDNDLDKQRMKGDSCENVNSESLFALHHDLKGNAMSDPEPCLGEDPESYSGNVTGPNDQANEMSGQPSGVPTGECVKGPPSGVVTGECVKEPPQGCAKREGSSKGVDFGYLSVRPPP